MESLNEVIWLMASRVRYFLSLEWLPWRKAQRKRELQEATWKRLLSYVGKLHTFDEWFEQTTLDTIFRALDRDIMVAFMKDKFPKEIRVKEEEFERYLEKERKGLTGTKGAWL